MKKLLFAVAIILSGYYAGFAQAVDSFDIATFRPPAGWGKQSKDGGVVFTTTDPAKGIYAMIVLYRSGVSSGKPSADFDADWKQYAAPISGIKTQPQMEPPTQTNGWQVTTGGGTFQGDLGTSALIMNTYTGFGKKFSVVAIFNTPDYAPAIGVFADSIVLDKTAAKPLPTSANPAAVSQIVGTWGQNLGAHMTYSDPVEASMAGYSKDQYTFDANGTYSFVSKTFRMSYDKILLVKENGTYEINGTTLKISPQKSMIQAWSKLNGGDAFGKLNNSQNRPLETVDYRFTKHYFSGIDQWQLVLQADKPTLRDGPFSTLTLFANAWYYQPISSNNPVIELPK